MGTAKQKNGGIFSVIERATPEDVALRWYQQYYDAQRGQWGNSNLGDAGRIYQRLKRAKTADDADRIIGNDTWTKPLCNTHLGRVSRAVQFGGTGDVSWIACGKCLLEAAAALKRSARKGKRE